MVSASYECMVIRNERNLGFAARQLPGDPHHHGGYGLLRTRRGAARLRHRPSRRLLTRIPTSQSRAAALKRMGRCSRPGAVPHLPHRAVESTVIQRFKPNSGGCPLLLLDRHDDVEQTWTGGGARACVRPSIAGWAPRRGLLQYSRSSMGAPARREGLKVAYNPIEGEPLLGQSGKAICCDATSSSTAASCATSASTTAPSAPVCCGRSSPSPFSRR